jgi:deoxycytidylate deaminase
MFGINMLIRQLPSAESYYMGMLYIGSAACKDPETQHAAILVDNDNVPLTPIMNSSLLKPAYNKSQDWSKKEIQLITAEELVVGHIENANNKVYPHNVVLYCSGRPSFLGVRRCAQAGLKKIVYGKMNPELFSFADWEKSKLLANEYEIKMHEFMGNVNWIRDRIQMFNHLF